MVKHRIPAGLDTTTDVAGVVDGTDWAADHYSPDFCVPLIVIASASTANPAPGTTASGIEVFAAARGTRRILDLTYVTQLRLTAQVETTGNAAGASLKVQYTTGPTATWASGSPAPADTGAEVVLGSNGGAVQSMHDSGWVNLAAGAKAANVVLAAVVGTTFGSTAPAVGSLMLYLR